MKDIETVLIAKERIQTRIKEMGAEITHDYAGKDLIMVGILKGAMPFLTDLMREVDLPVTIDTMCVSSYGSGTESSGEIRIKKDLDSSIRGKDVLIVEDIIDTGLTLAALMPALKAKGAASVALAVCMDKQERRRVHVDVRYRGFVVPDKFIVGYGCDYAGKYRNIPEICTLKKEKYAKQL